MTLEERINRLEDIEAIKQLKARYCEACDDEPGADTVSELFTEDGVWDGGGSNRVEGRRAIRERFKAIGHAVEFSQHNVTNPLIEVNGNRATGVWNLFEFITFRENGNTKLLSVRYDEKYTKVDGQWKFQLLKGRTLLMTAVEVLPWELPS